MRGSVGLRLVIALGAVWTGAWASAVAAADGVRYVDLLAPGGGDGTSWDTAYRFLQDALAEAAHQMGEVEEIRVAWGTHRPDHGGGYSPGDRRAKFDLVSGVRVQGGYAGVLAADPDERDLVQFETVLSGADWRFYHVVTARGTGPGTLLDGFTITEGNATGRCCRDDRGGGMYLSGADLTVRACRFSQNLANNVAAAVWMARSTARFVGCVFEENFVSPGNSGGAIQDERPGGNPVRPVPGDLDGDRVVDGVDLAMLLEGWGVPGDCLADLDADGDVDFVDLVTLLNRWTGVT